MPYWVYILRCADDTLYTGIATDVDRRFRAHAGGRGAKYTRTHGAVEIVYRACCGEKGDALRREAAIKKLTRAEKLALIAADISNSGTKEGGILP